MNFSFGAEGSGLYFTIVITVLNGVATAEVKMIEGTMDLNALYWSDGDETAGEGSMAGFTKKDSALNMNGAEGSAQAWDGGQKLSNAGLGSAGTEKSTFLSTGDTKTFTLSNLTDISQAEFLGVRATSVNGGDSIKLVDEGEKPTPPGNDDFPLWGQDISNIILVFEQEAGDTKPKPDGDGFYTVKIDSWPGAAGDDLDDSIDAILAYLVANDQFVTGDANLLGVIIKGGIQDTNFYAYGDNNTNGTLADDAPDGLALTWEGSSNPAPGSAVDASYDYGSIFI